MSAPAPGQGVPDGPAPRPFDLSALAVALGLSGLAGAWGSAVPLLGAPGWCADLLALAALAAVLVIAVRYVRALACGANRFGDDLDGFAFSYFPLVGVLLGERLYIRAPTAAFWLIIACALVVGLFGARLVARWCIRPVRVESLHTGYFVPLIAGAFVTSPALSLVGARGPAMAEFGIGIMLWVMIGAVVTVRLWTREPLPPSQWPLLAILVAPPATAGTAWVTMNGGRGDAVVEILVGITALFIVVELFLVPGCYLRAPATTAMWSFTFPSVATANFLVRWLATAPFGPWRPAAWAVLALATAVVVAVAGLTVRALPGARPVP